MFECPHCNNKTISFMSKYLAGKWAVMKCGQCGKRSTAHPIPLLILYFFYVWDLVLFIYLYLVTAKVSYLITMLVVWLILDLFSMYVPSARLKSTAAEQKSG